MRALPFTLRSITTALQSTLRFFTTALQSTLRFFTTANLSAAGDRLKALQQKCPATPLALSAAGCGGYLNFKETRTSRSGPKSGLRSLCDFADNVCRLLGGVLPYPPPAPSKLFNKVMDLSKLALPNLQCSWPAEFAGTHCSWQV